MRQRCFARPARRAGLALAALVLSLAAVTSSAQADGPTVAAARIECQRAPEPGRIRCEVEVRAPPGAVLKWADVAIVRTPPFATALRARVGPLEASAREDTVWRWAIALAARDRGTGELEARVRVVACVKDACTPSEAAASATVVVGE